MESDAPSAWVVRHAFRIRPGGLVLDLAAGGGRHVRYLRQLGYRVLAVDIDVSRLADLRADPGVDVVEADLERGRWPFDGRRFDGIVVTSYLHRPLFPILEESLTPGGVLIYETFARGHEQYGRPTNPAFLLDEGELRRQFSKRLEVIEYEQALDAPPRAALKQRICAKNPELSERSA